MFKKFITKIYDPLYTEVLTCSSIIMIIFGVNLYFINILYLNIIGIILTLVSTLNICILAFRMFNWEFNKEESELTSKKIFKNEDSIKKEEYNIPRDINDLIFEIDNKLKDGFVFQTISKEKWNNSYKTQIINLCNSRYAIEFETKERILNILNILSKDLIDKKKEEDTINKDATLCALEALLILDGLHK